MNTLTEKLHENKKKTLKVETLITILELARKVECELSQRKNSHLCHGMELTKVRNEILSTTLSHANDSDQEMLDLVQKIHRLNGTLKCLGIFKMKNKK